LKDLTIKQASEIYTLLKSPEVLPDAFIRAPELYPSQIIESEVFRLDLRKYSQQLQSVLLARTNDEKKKSFEGLAKLLFDGISFLSCKYTDLRTASGEIDIVVQYHGWKKLTVFDEFGRYFLVECKNWKSSVGAKQVRDFIGKLQKAKLRLGVLFARNGISGAHGGADALREIHAAFDAHRLYILVISEEDLKAIEHGTNFYLILDRKIDNLRFDL